MAERKKLTTKEKEALVSTAKCYVCEDLGVDHAGFDGYDLKDVHLDHYQTSFGSPGGEDTDVLPIHGATGGAIPDDPDFETSTRRNCHRLRGNDYTTRAGYVQVLRARLQARTVSFVDDAYENPARDHKARQYKLPVKWEEGSANFMDKSYPLVIDQRPTRTWRRFLTTLRADQLFTDDTSQVRPAAKKSLLKMIQTFLIDGFPIFAPINARVDKCGHVVVFDGNHRATAHALAFGVKELMPVMIWDIAPGEDCALRDHVSMAGTATPKEK
ncbi:hypothetical protein [Nocardioides pinisoli]|uniref:ParB/Sulfiredoxin domain-containing protein n=1 Tax=Nocardioides pinisoli TaxID=2950279 RepID=A0ABT1KSI4_9ACTN|nr:hypothetical protein [Nocardioides pinisoli]MCP3420354.1 hypothetical protein [Nocardioides pinisoli]